MTELARVSHARYNLALAVVLGRDLDGVVCDTKATAQECIAWLRANQVAPIQFFPLDTVRPKARCQDPCTLKPPCLPAHASTHPVLPARPCPVQGARALAPCLPAWCTHLPTAAFVSAACLAPFAPLGLRMMWRWRGFGVARPACFI